MDVDNKIIIKNNIERPISTLIYSVEITNGYVFRQIFELYDKLVLYGIPIVFKESGITIRAGTSGTKGQRKLISDIEIYTDDIYEYYLNKELATTKGTDDQSACFVEQFNINTIRTIFKSVAKSNSIRMYKTTLSDTVMIDIKGLTTEHSRLLPTKYQGVDLDTSCFDNQNEVPNVKIEITPFCSSMKGMTRGDPEYTSFKVYKTGLLVASMGPSGSLMKDNRWGNVETDNFYETKVNLNVIKALCKINGMVNYSIVKIFSSNNGCMKISHKISDFGEHNIYLIDDIQ